MTFLVRYSFFKCTTPNKAAIKVDPRRCRQEPNPLVRLVLSPNFRFRKHVLSPGQEALEGALSLPLSLYPSSRMPIKSGCPASTTTSSASRPRLQRTTTAKAVTAAANNFVIQLLSFCAYGVCADRVLRQVPSTSCEASGLARPKPDQTRPDGCWFFDLSCSCFEDLRQQQKLPSTTGKGMADKQRRPRSVPSVAVEDSANCRSWCPGSILFYPVCFLCHSWQTVFTLPAAED